ncbi:MAG: elongation factor P maturation arginine rhamnosyltransferase EarP [Nitrosomonadales bacterium]|nr:elongation factor P maturation arginine rhamnosyltransferase EarP [Nitrosomonadales bacterium]
MHYKPATCDIFCAVVDNYGDIGVCWRLARQLANEHGIAVRLWVDDLASFRKLCPEIDSGLPAQSARGATVRHWTADAFRAGAQTGGGGAVSAAMPAELVIEAFACKLPESYVAAMAAQARKPVWINLEHLSAEGWIEGCHKLPSPHPQLPLVKYFFFPGFTPQTGGLLLERDLLARRDAFQRDRLAVDAFWQMLGVSPPGPDETRVSLFCYENPALPELLAAWAEGDAPVCCMMPEGRALPQVKRYFEDAGRGLSRHNRHAGTPGGYMNRFEVNPGLQGYSHGNLEVRVLPFAEQERYDQLLWACDINFVRGEDSCVRAQWAGSPFVWHIYPQHDGVHMQKLRAFLALYCAGLPPDAAQALRGLWEAWNGEGGQGVASPSPIRDAWNDFRAHGSMLRQHATAWAQQLSGNSLALKLLDFFHEVGKIRAS